MKPGQRVRIKTDPSRIGTLTDKTRMRGRHTSLQVSFPDGFEFITEGQLELFEESEQGNNERTLKFAGRKALRNNITRRRLGGHLANVIYSMESTDTDFYPYQFKPVLNLLDSQSKSLLIADEVGLGKTIEAGLIWTELRSRLDANRLLVVCPAMLREKWVRELRNRFGVDARIADAKELLEALSKEKRREINEFALVCSKDGIRPPRNYEDGDASMSANAKLAQYFIDNEADDPLFDLVIVDEAHYMRNPESLTSKLGRLLRPVTDYMVLLSATPIQLASSDLFQLLRILDPQTFAFFGSFRHILSANEPLNKLFDALQTENLTREKLVEGIRVALQHELLANNRQLTYLLENAPNDIDLATPETRAQIGGDLEKINLLSKSISRTRKRQVTEWRVIREAIPQFVEMHPVEEAFYESVTELIANYCKERDIGRGFLLTTPQRQIASCMPAALKAWASNLAGAMNSLEEEIYEDIGQDESFQESTDVGPLKSLLIESSRGLGSYEQLKKVDTKYKNLEEILKQFFEHHQDEKVIIFSYFRQTIKYLEERLLESGISNKILMGGAKVNKDEVIREFETDASTRVLVCTEVASEGVDLQFCRVLINYDLPWNPMKVEQRIGRIDRLGQPAEKITIWNLFYANTVDARIYERLHARLQIFEYALGGLEAILGDEIKSLTYDLLAGGLSADEQVARIAQTEQALANLRRENEELESKASYLIAHSQYILNEVVAAKALQRFITNSDLASFVTEFLEEYYQGSKVVQSDSDPRDFEIILSVAARADFSEYLKRSKSKRATFLVNPPDKKLIYRFDNKTKRAPAAIELINQFHPIIQFINGILNQSSADIFESAVIVPKRVEHEIPPGEYAFFVKRWQLNGVKTQERLAYSAVELSTARALPDDLAERLVNIASDQGLDWAGARNVLDYDSVQDAYSQCLDHLGVTMQRFIERMKRENEDRADILEQTVRSHFEGEILRIEENILNYRAQGKTRMIPANEGKVKKNRARMQTRIQQIKSGREIRHSETEVAMGVIRVEA